VAAAMKTAGVGLFRVMPEPDTRAENALRRTAATFGIEWLASQSIGAIVGHLDATNPAHQAFAMAARRAGGGASYATYATNPEPWHAAMAATYAHATAPMRRLADRFVLRTVKHVVDGESIDSVLSERLDRLPVLMDRQENVAAKLDRGAIDLVEAVTMVDRIGQHFDAVVVDTNERGCTVQIVEPPVRTRLDAKGLEPGQKIAVSVAAVDVSKRRVDLSLVG
jgi:exoribonuclease R